MRNRDDVERVTRRYSDLRSLEMMPIWGLMSVTGLGEALGWLPPEVPAPRSLLLVPVVAATWLLHRYFDRNFGVVRPRPSGKGWLVLAIIAFYALQVTAIRVGLRVDLTAPALGLMAGYAALRDRGFRKHWIVPAVACVLLPFIAPVGIPTAVRSPAAAISWAVIGATFAFASLWDDRLLVRSLNDARS